MKIYLDLLFLFNWWIDFFLLLIVKLSLKRNVALLKIVLASFIGAFTTFLVFLNINYYVLFAFKVIMSFFIVIVAFGFKNINYLIKNFWYLFMSGFTLGGISFFLKIKSINKTCYLLFVFLITPLMLYFYYLQNKSIKRKYNLYLPVILSVGNLKNIRLNGFVDSGNNLIDPITKKPVLLIQKEKLKGINKIRSPMYIPIKTINNDGLIKCYKPDVLIINNRKYKNFLIGVVNHSLGSDGVDCLLHNTLLEDL